VLVRIEDLPSLLAPRFEVSFTSPLEIWTILGANNELVCCPLSSVMSVKLLVDTTVINPIALSESDVADYVRDGMQSLCSLSHVIMCKIRASIDVLIEWPIPVGAYPDKKSLSVVAWGEVMATISWIF
jgi:hypothetical protein